MNNKQIFFVTGGTSGIGKETVRALSKTNAMVVFTSRDSLKGEQVKKEILEETGNTDVEFIECDLASLSSVGKCADEFKRRYERIDVLINNAGVLPQERQESKDGIELNLAVNFLAPFLLTSLLLPLLKQSAPSRIINVSSSMHKEGKINFDDLENKEHFDKYVAYSQSKLALLLVNKLLSNDLDGTGVTVNALHPGIVSTEMTMQNVKKMNPLAAFIFKRTLIDSADGAITSVYLATSPEVASISGEYFVDCKIEKTMAIAKDMSVARKLVAVVEDKYLANYLP